MYPLNDGQEALTRGAIIQNSQFPQGTHSGTIRPPEFTQRQFHFALSCRFFWNLTPCNLVGTDYLLEGIFPSSSGFMYKKDYNPVIGSRNT
jgi:hypothetical protein